MTMEQAFTLGVGVGALAIIAGATIGFWLAAWFDGRAGRTK